MIHTTLNGGFVDVKLLQMALRCLINFNERVVVLWDA